MYDLRRRFRYYHVTWSHTRSTYFPGSYLRMLVRVALLYLIATRYHHQGTSREQYVIYFGYSHASVVMPPNTTRCVTAPPTRKTTAVLIWCPSIGVPSETLQFGTTPCLAAHCFFIIHGSTCILLQLYHLLFLLYTQMSARHNGTFK